MNDEVPAPADVVLCRLCGFDKSLGEHGVFQFRPDAMSFVICKPVVVTHNPQRLGIITSITGGDD